MIINIHGFNGSKENSVYRWISSQTNDPIYGATFNYAQESPESVLNHYRTEVIKHVEKGEKVSIIGTSLGGFYAYCLNAEFNEIPTVLINPCLNPHLHRDILEGINYQLLQQYVSIYGTHILKHSNSSCIVVEGDEDECINHKILTNQLFASENIYIIEGATHNIAISENECLQNLLLQHIKKFF